MPIRKGSTLPRAVEWPVESDERPALGAMRQTADHLNVITFLRAPALLMGTKSPMG